MPFGEGLSPKPDSPTVHLTYPVRTVLRLKNTGGQHARACGRTFRQWRTSHRGLEGLLWHPVSRRAVAAYRRELPTSAVNGHRWDDGTNAR